MNEVQQSSIPLHKNYTYRQWKALMRLVRSSVPGAVERDKALHLLAERAVLTRMVCAELVATDLRSFNRRPAIALSFLLRWVQENMPEYVRTEPHPADGIDQLVVPDGYENIIDEIRAGAQVAEALFRLYTADTSHEADKDRAVLEDRLTRYWIDHRAAVAIKWL